MADESRITKIVSMPQPEYEEFLANVITKYYKPGFDEIVFNLNDKNRLSLMRFIVMLNARFKEMGMIVPLLKFSDRTIDVQGGFELTNGTDSIDCSLETLIEQNESLLPY